MRLIPNVLHNRESTPTKRLPWLILAFAASYLVPSKLFCQDPAYYEPEQVEFALLVRVLSFAEWDNHEETDSPRPLHVGIYEDQNFLNTAFELVGKSGSTLNVQLHSIDADTPVKKLAKLDVLFFTNRNNRTLKKTLEKANELPILMVGKFDGFLREGGMLNLQRKRGKPTFEVHIGNSRKAGITFRSKLLKLATRVIK